MKVIFSVLLLFVLLTASAHAMERKYGYLAASDAQLAERLKSPDTAGAVLGLIYKCEKIHDVWYYHIKVVESYKGDFKRGDKIFVFVEAENFPEPDKEIGQRRYFILQKMKGFPSYGEKVDEDIVGKFWCDAWDAVRYEDFGEELHQAFIKAGKQ
jgi:hypothetical protein